MGRRINVKRLSAKAQERMRENMQGKAKGARKSQSIPWAAAAVLTIAWQQQKLLWACSSAALSGTRAATTGSALLLDLSDSC